jgi:hypothetical protein
MDIPEGTKVILVTKDSVVINRIAPTGDLQQAWDDTQALYPAPDFYVQGLPEFPPEAQPVAE